jgi:hypothetical protein
VLRATQYLPDIVRLQQCLYDAFHHRLDKKDAVTQSVREFLDNLTTGTFKASTVTVQLRLIPLTIILFSLQKMLVMSIKKGLGVCRKLGA